MIIATDLDRTLLPNGHDEYQVGAIQELFDKLAKVEHHLFYVSGRNLDLMQDAVAKYGIKIPDYFIAEVGTRIYEKQKGEIKILEAWDQHIRNTNRKWQRQIVVHKLDHLKALELQEGWKQNKFKVSYYLKDMKLKDDILAKIDRELDDEQITAKVVYSVDPVQKLGLIDILPYNVNKLEAIEFLRKMLGQQIDNVIYCGDSGNDILPLTFGYKAIAVKNTPQDVKDTISELAKRKGVSDHLYIADGKMNQNGNYASGIIEGLEKFGII